MRNTTGIILVILYALVRLGLRSLKRVQQVSGTPQHSVRNTFPKKTRDNNRAVYVKEKSSNLPEIETEHRNMPDTYPDKNLPFEFGDEESFSERIPLIEGFDIESVQSQATRTQERDFKQSKFQLGHIVPLLDRGDVVSAMVAHELFGQPVSSRSTVV